MLVLIGVVLLSIFFLVVLFLCAKTWKIMHIFAMFLVYGAAVAFCVFATISLKTNAAWKEKVAAMRAELAEQQKVKEELEVGKLDTLATADDSQLVLPKELWRQTYNRGQVLRGCTPGNFDGTSVTVTTVAAADPAAVAPADGSAAPAPPPNGLSPQMIVHVFKEANTPDGKIPVFYIGEFEVQSPTDTSATLRAVLPLDSIQKAVANSRDGSTWAVYGNLPRDSHYAFVDPEARSSIETAKEAVRVAEQELAEAKRLAALGKDNAGVGTAEQKLKSAQDDLQAARAKAQPLFGQTVDSQKISSMLPTVQQLKQMVPRSVFPPEPEVSNADYDKLIQDMHQQMVQRYAFDGLPLADIEAKAPGFNPAGDTYQKIKFQVADGKPYAVDVDAPGDPLPEDEVPQSGDLYDVAGLAKPKRLRQGGPTRFTNVYDIGKRFSDPDLGASALGDIGIFDQETADRLTADGTIAEKLDDQFYVRPLRDYDYLFHEYYRRDDLLTKEAADIRAATTKVADAATAAQKQVAIRQEQKGKLDADRERFQTDLDVVTAERQNLAEAREGQLNELRWLFQQINGQVAELNRLQRQLADEAQKRAAMASAGGQ